LSDNLQIEFQEPLRCGYSAAVARLSERSADSGHIEPFIGSHARDKRGHDDLTERALSCRKNAVDAREDGIPPRDATGFLCAGVTV